MLVMGLVLGQSLMVISTTGIPLYAKVSLLYNVIWECIFVVNKHFDRSLHVGSPDPTCVQKFRPVPLTVFEIQGFKLKNKKDNNDNKKKNWRNRLLPYLPCLWSNSHQNLGATLAIILRC